MTLSFVQTDAAPRAIGPYSQAVRCGALIFCSGQLPTDPVTGVFVGDDIEDQTRQCLKNLAAILEAADIRLDRVVKTTVFLKNMEDFAKMNAIYEEEFASHRPARSTIEVARLPKDALVEIEAVASL